ncbi:MAG: DUF2520 domain-containing protein [Bacteroidaceae bacterium]|nr:DUF2520 domain-containing protein [Bacteroidaceae bacterium]
MKISIIGRGNVGSHLHKAFTEAGMDTVLCDSREMKDLRESAIYIICVKDDVIGEVAEKLSVKLCKMSCGNNDIAEKALVVHTAGTKPMSLLDGKFQNYGVLYPMQTFSKEKELEYREIPIFLEANNEKGMAVLKELAEGAFENISVLTSAERKVLHIAAVFTSNFTNHMLTLADEQLQTIGLNYKVMLPLLKEVTDKLLHLPPQKAQTGPAIRKDLSVVNEHISLIEDPLTREIYKLVSESIAAGEN